MTMSRDREKVLTNTPKSADAYRITCFIFFSCIQTCCPKGIGEIRFRDTCAEAIKFFQQRRGKIGTKVDEACYELYEMESDLLEEVKGDKTKSVLFYACRLALQQLQSLKTEEQVDWGCKEKWDMINEVWVELVGYAAVHCGWKEHGQQLRRGGELLTHYHICLLMAHLGLSEQYQTTKVYFHIFENRLTAYFVRNLSTHLVSMMSIVHRHEPNV